VRDDLGGVGGETDVVDRRQSGYSRRKNIQV
jgi:hypothetical protein